MFTPTVLQAARAVDSWGKGTLCNQDTCERTHHEDMVVSSNIKTQLSKLVSRGRERGFLQRDTQAYTPEEIHLLLQ